jgi:hypothetical protein
VFRFAELGISQAGVARASGVPRATVRGWLKLGKQAVLGSPMRTGTTRGAGRQSDYESCDDPCPFSRDIDAPAYAYLLGQYLGDGCISRTSSSLRLRLACCNAYPDIMDECAAAIRAVKPAANVGYITNVGCTEVYSTWAHWPCLLPHGPGRKHLRTIVLQPWQRDIAIDRFPDQFIRGLIHSDGCRAINRIKAVSGKNYEYVRYFFSNESEDIRQLFFDTCKRLEIDARHNMRNSISVARKESVRRLEEIVGPKS